MSSAKFVKTLIGKTKTAVKLDQYLSKSEEWQDSVVRVMMTGILKNQYYRSADQAAKEALPLFINAAKKDPEFLLKAAVFARNANMKGMVKLGVAALNGNAKGSFLSQNREHIVTLLKTFHPGQLLQFVELCKSKSCGRGFGSRPQNWVRNVMESWKEDRLEDYTLKYPTALYHLVRLVHPRLVGAQGKLISYVLTDNSKNKPTGKKQKAVERLKKPGTTTTKIAKDMIEYEIPWDVIKGFSGMNDSDLCMAMMTQMGLSALLLNIRSLQDHGVFNSRDGLTALKLKLEEVKDGRSIPIDFAKPYIHSTNAKVKELLVDTIVKSLDINMPEIEGLKVGVSVDVSGSMAGEALLTAGLLTVPFLKAKSLWFTTFDNNLYEEGETGEAGSGYRLGYSRGMCPKISHLSRERQVKALLNLHAAGGTDVGISVRAATSQKKRLDLHVLITDDQQNFGMPLVKAWKIYRQTVNPIAELWIINASNYEWHSADFNDPSITVYQTMTPAIFKNLKYFGMDLVTEVSSLKL